MAIEIERKFLVDRQAVLKLLPNHEWKEIRQFYVVANRQLAVRLRLVNSTDAVVTVKHDAVRARTQEHEFVTTREEYFSQSIDKIGAEIVKIRYLVPHNGKTWEVDVFEEHLGGLIIAEIECHDAEELNVSDFPLWITEEVTHDPRYKNAVLALEGYPT